MCRLNTILILWKLKKRTNVISGWPWFLYYLIINNKVQFISIYYIDISHLILSNNPFKILIKTSNLFV